MNARIYRYFLTVAQTKSYGRAARALYITPQGLQSALKRLEASVGVPLLNSSEGEIELTDYGRIFYRHARAIIQEQDFMLGEIDTLYNRRTGRLLLSVSTGLFNIIPREAIDDFNAHAKSGVHVEVARTMVDFDCDQSLLDRECDFALINDPVDHTLFSAIPLHKDTMFLWIDETSPLASHDRLRCSDLKGLTVACVSPLEFKTSQSIKHALGDPKLGCTIRPMDEMIAVLEMAMSGKAHALTVRTHAEAFRREGFKGVPIEDLTWGFSVAYRIDRILSERDREFLDFLKSHAAFYY